ncbi:MAG TPA: lytic transglycosylase domain-containing protein [Puia sp.]|nr:lytic transglycosylase domain-containing protein [Puia sp.]
MLKPKVPFYFCTLFLTTVVAPTTANPSQPVMASGKKLVYAPAPASVSTASPKTSRTNKISLAVANPQQMQQQMKFVHAYIRNNDDCLLTVKHRSEGPFAIIDSVLNHYGLPLELKYLAVIESELKPTALSRVGAKGPWQLMPSTAHVLGLKVSRRADERVNYYKSTRAAARYLKDLHREFKDWLLVLAAYNGGPKPVYKAIRKANSKNFWVLQKYLPAESRQHVKKFIATAYYFERADSANAAKTANIAATAPAQPQTVGSPAMTLKKAPESDDEKFSRLMKESATSLKASNELLETTN